MEIHSDWYNRTVKEINLHKEYFSKKDSKKYKLDLLLRLAKRMDEFSAICGKCQDFKEEITRLVGELGNLVQLPDSKVQRKSYNKTISTIVEHLKKEHKLVSDGFYLGIGMAIGTGVGTALGIALGSPGVGPGLGVGIGFAIGGYLDKKAKKEGRVI